jgi:hypothetical protein
VTGLNGKEVELVNEIKKKDALKWKGMDMTQAKNWVKDHARW